MVENKSEQTVKDEILNLVKEYCNTYHCQKREFYGGDCPKTNKLMN